jgi:mRNA-degrading endonuclease RelE of RelBE toxin-antitoxin system
MKPKKKKTYSLQNWEIIVVIIASFFIVLIAILEISYECLSERFPLLFSAILSISAGFISAIIILYIMREHNKKELFNYYKPIAGNYIRRDIGQDTVKSDAEDKSFKERNIGLKIEMKYIGQNSFQVIANYWSDQSAIVEAILEFDSNNRQIANGRYRYTKGDNYKGHMGTYRVFRDIDDKKLIVLYRHIFPRGKGYSTDQFYGWEIWEKE